MVQHARIDEHETFLSKPKFRLVLHTRTPEKLHFWTRNDPQRAVELMVTYWRPEKYQSRLVQELPFVTTH